MYKNCSEMIPLKLDLPILHTDIKLNFKDKIFFIGSCFAENIGNYLKTNSFDVEINPFGIVYHPIAIFNEIQQLIDNRIYTEKDLVFNQNLWHSWEHHGRFSHLDKTICLEQINLSIEKARTHLKDTKYLFLTFGSSIVYELLEQQKIVSNCHKFPSNQFKKYFLSLEPIQQAFDTFYRNIKAFNPDINIICTISPVRHWRDGLIENNKSKSRLIYCVHDWIEKYKNVSYFPAYELILDDLRDYRFYERDLCHPNQMGIDYVIDYFQQMYYDEPTKLYVKEIEAYLKFKQHKPQFEQEKHYKKLEALKFELERKFQLIIQ